MIPEKNLKAKIDHSGIMEFFSIENETNLV